MSGGPVPVDDQDTQDSSSSSTTKKKTTVEDRIKGFGKVADEFGRAIDTVFGQAQPAPSFVPSHVSTGPPQVTQPYGGFSTAGAGGHMPPAPTPGGSPAPPPVGIMQTGTEFRTSGGKNAAIVGGAIQNISGALHNMAEEKKEKNIREAKYLYDLANVAYQQGDMKTFDLIMNDDKRRKKIEKYLTGELPMFSKPASAGTDKGGAQGQADPGMGGKQQPGAPPQQDPTQQRSGVAMPAPSTAEQIQAAKQAMVLEGLKNQDPRIMSAVFGEQATLSKEDYGRAMRGKFGIELTPVQLEAMNHESQLALATAKTDAMKYLAGQEMITQRLMATTEMHTASAEKIASGHDRARVEAAQTMAAAYKAIRGAPADKMEEVMYKQLGDFYRSMAVATQSSIARIAKDDPKLAKQLQQQVDELNQKAQSMGDMYRANKDWEDMMKEGGPVEDVPPPEEPDTSKEDEDRATETPD